jgi:hypothetical protein
MAAGMRERWPVNQTESYLNFSTNPSLAILQCSFSTILAGMHSEPNMETG